MGFYAHVFEPVRDYFVMLSERFDNAGAMGKVYIHHYGLSDRNESAFIDLASDGSSVVPRSDRNSELEAKKQVEKIDLKSFDDFFYGPLKRLHGGKIDLLYINCEGCEYPLLKSLLRKNGCAMCDVCSSSFTRLLILRTRWRTGAPCALDCRKPTRKNSRFRSCGKDGLFEAECSSFSAHVYSAH